MRPLPVGLAREGAESGPERSSPFGVEIRFPLGKALLPDCRGESSQSREGPGVPSGGRSAGLHRFDDLSVHGLKTCAPRFPRIQMHMEREGKLKEKREKSEKQSGFQGCPAFASRAEAPSRSPGMSPAGLEAEGSGEPQIPQDRGVRTKIKLPLALFQRPPSILILPEVYQHPAGLHLRSIYSAPGP